MSMNYYDKNSKTPIILTVNRTTLQKLTVVTLYSPVLESALVRVTTYTTKCRKRKSSS